MENRIYIKDLKDHIGKEITIAGWVDVRRDHGKLIFIDLRDGSGKVQMVALPNHEDTHKVSDTARSEWVLKVTGKVNERPEKMVNKDEANGNIEVEMTGVEVLSEAQELPFEKDAELNLDTYLDSLPFALRDPKKRAIFKVQATIIQSFRWHLIQKGFVEIQVPKLTGEDAEGGANTFEVDYFGKPAHLATSPQFYKQIMVGVFEKVFTSGQVYRAEKHSTSRHINEYTSLDLEFGFIKDHTDVMNVLSDLIRDIVTGVKERCAEELKMLEAELPEVPKEIPVLKLREAQKILDEEFDQDCQKEPDLEPQHERMICEWAQKKHNSDFVYITHYPVEKRPMYTYEDENDPGFTKSFDLLFRGVEITTGGQRIHDYDTLVANIKKWKLDPEKFSYYLQAFKYGMPPEGGLGMGLERLTAKLLGLDNVKEATLFPRDLNRIDTLLSG